MSSVDSPVDVIGNVRNVGSLKGQHRLQAELHALVFSASIWRERDESSTITVIEMTHDGFTTQRLGFLTSHKPSPQLD
jgi:hypothetical protein